MKNITEKVTQTLFAVFSKTKYDVQNIFYEVQSVLENAYFDNTVKTYRFFYHYVKQSGKMSFHFRNKCFHVDEIVCIVPSNSKRNKQQPYVVMQGFCQGFKIINNKLFIY